MHIKSLYLIGFKEADFCFVDNKLYGAYLSYHYSTNMDKFAKEQTSDAVSMVRDELVNLGFSVYDEIKDGIYIESKSLHILSNTNTSISFTTSVIQLQELTIFKESSIACHTVLLIVLCIYAS